MEGDSIQSQMENGELGDVQIKDEVMRTNFAFRLTNNAKSSKNELNLVAIQIRNNFKTR